MVNTALEDCARDAGIVLSGSVIAVPRARRAALVERLLAGRHWVHADVIAGSYLGQEGVLAGEIPALAAAAGPRLDIHLMVDELKAAIDALPRGIGRVTIQCPPGGELGDLVDQARGKAPSVWIALDDPSPTTVARALAAEADGILAMLTPPGQPGYAADLGRLGRIRGAIGARVPLGVDGGVNEALIEQLKAAGVVYAVAGRALVNAVTEVP
ncbi:hypothetical protein [Sinomonas sp. ASV322]|uniref:hypothetical protein n=1 Tax=Sinomonas sp. ASV322 TaxID=3041920 RepID=UPI0027DD36C3|nr:hypothetical protein [Sinomonas sp. ASV322]MDQ4501279.1 hypothetical protein [Sinomonas sp. ASV322]